MTNASFITANLAAGNHSAANLTTYDMSSYVRPDLHSALSQVRSDCWQVWALESGEIDNGVEAAANGTSAEDGWTNNSFKSGATAQALESCQASAVALEVQRLLVQNAKDGVTSISLDFGRLSSQMPKAQEFAEKYLEGRMISFQGNGSVITTSIDRLH